MEITEYLEKIEEVNTVIYSPKKDLKIKLQLIAPIKRVKDCDFYLVIGGAFLAPIKNMYGIYLYEFFKVVNKKIYPILDKKNASYVIDETISNIKKIFLEAEEVEILRILSSYLDEIRRYMKGQTLTDTFKSVTPYKYSITYRRPDKVYVMADNKKSSIHEMHEVLSSLEYQKVLQIVYPSVAAKDECFLKYLEDKPCFYNVLLSDGTMPYHTFQRMADAGLDQVIIPLSSLNSDTEMKITGRDLKMVLSVIKQARDSNLKVSILTKVTKDNLDYLELVRYLKGHGIRSFYLEFQEDVSNKDIILKQANYYLHMYSLEFKLINKGILRDKELNRLGIYPLYKENMVSSYYTKGDFVLFIDAALKYRLGSLSMDKISSLYNSSLAKKLRKESLKGK